MESWFVLRYEANKIQSVRMRVIEMGVEEFSPALLQTKRRSDCNGHRTTPKVLFPGYLFLRFDPEKIHTTAISAIAGTKGFVRFGDQPCKVSESLIKALQLSRLLTISPSVDSIECRNVSPEILAAIQRIAGLHSKAERQAALYALLQEPSIEECVSNEVKIYSTLNITQD